MAKEDRARGCWDMQSGVQSLTPPPLPPGLPFPPQDVRLEAQNFHVQLWWEQDPRTPGEATYQVEWKRR